MLNTNKVSQSNLGFVGAFQYKLVVVALRHSYFSLIKKISNSFFFLMMINACELFAHPITFACNRIKFLIYSI